LGQKKFFCQDNKTESTGKGGPGGQQVQKGFWGHPNWTERHPAGGSSLDHKNPDSGDSRFDVKEMLDNGSKGTSKQEPALGQSFQD